METHLEDILCFKCMATCCTYFVATAHKYERLMPTHVKHTATLILLKNEPVHTTEVPPSALAPFFINKHERPQTVGLGEIQCAENRNATDLCVTPKLWAQSC